MRKLVTRRVVDKLIPINGADRIELALVDGWSCIVKKGEFRVGEEAIYFEIDSFIPSSDLRFSFLGEGKVKEFGKIKGWRIRTMKMRGVLSQGLLLPVAMFNGVDLTVEDIAPQLGVVKWESSKDPIPTKTSLKPLTSLIYRTDQERLQNVMHYFTEFREHEFEETLKLDGASCSMYKILKAKSWWQKLLEFIQIDYTTEHFGVCSRTLEIGEGDSMIKVFDNNGIRSVYNQQDFWDVAKKYNIIETLPAGFSVQGELLGPNIQGNHEKVKNLEFHIFDVFDIGKQEYLTPSDRLQFLEVYLPDTLHVPILQHSVKIFKQCRTLDELQERVTGKGMNAGVVSEGRVYKSLSAPDLSFKLISNEFLLRYDD